MKEKKLFGEYFKASRIAIKKTLRQFCIENGLDPGNISKLERGLLPPPQSRENLRNMPAILKLRRVRMTGIRFLIWRQRKQERFPMTSWQKER